MPASTASTQAVLSESQWFLDASSMIQALRFQPGDFDYAHGWLNHVPSRHRFRFDRDGRVFIAAACGCSGRQVRQEQSRELFETFAAWRTEYWQPLQTNKEFASHFRKPGAWGRLFRDLRMAWRQFLGHAGPVTLSTDEASAIASRSSA